MINRLLITILLGIILMPNKSYAQTNEDLGTVIVFKAERKTAPSYRVTEQPKLIDTVIPLPNFTYPLLNKSVETSISVSPIKPSRIKIVEKLEKLYPGYVKLGLGNYTMPLGELYYNALRNRKFNYGLHLNHLSSFGRIKEYAPSQFDKTTSKVFTDFFLKNHILKTQFDYMNHGYHYYGIKNDSISKDSLRNRVSAYKGQVRFLNTPARDSAKLLYDAYIDYQFFHEFNKDTFELSKRNVRENTINFGSVFKYKYQENIFAVDFNIRLNYYKFGEGDTTVAPKYRMKTRNNIFSLHPNVTTFQFKDKLMVEAGIDLNFDLNSKTIFKPVPVIKAQYDLLKGILIPYAGMDGDLTQNSFYTMNQINPYIVSSLEIENQKEFRLYGGLKGSFSKYISYNVMVHTTNFKNKALFVNDTIFSDQYKFGVVYDDVRATGIEGSLTFQQKEKLKVDGYTRLNKYIANTEKYAWNLPDLVIGMRGTYNMYSKIYLKADVSLQGGRKSPAGLFKLNGTEDDFKLGFISDINLEAEYRYNKRLSGFIQFNNMMSQRYLRWANYPVHRFQILGGITFSF